MVEAYKVRQWLDIIQSSSVLMSKLRLLGPPSEFDRINQSACALDRVYRELQAAVTKPLEIEQ